MLTVTLLALCLPAVSPLGETIEGFTEPYRQIDIGPAEPGTIASVSVREGDHVRKGQRVAALDCEVLAVSLEIARAAMESRGRLDSAAAERDLRKSRLEKLVELQTRGHASQEEVDRARADLAIAQASVLAAREQQIIDSLEYKKTAAMIERRTLRSPIDGIVTRIYREEREFVTATDPAVLTVVQLDPLRITFSVPSVGGTLLTAGQTVRLSFPDAGVQAEGKVEFVSPVTEADSGTVRVKVLLDNPEGHNRSGVRCCLVVEGL